MYNELKIITIFHRFNNLVTTDFIIFYYNVIASNIYYFIVPDKIIRARISVDMLLLK